MRLRTQPVTTRGDEKLRDIYSDASDIPVATRVHHTMADEIVKRHNAFESEGLHKASRAWNAECARVCGVDAEDSWKIYGEDHIQEVKFIMAEAMRD